MVAPTRTHAAKDAKLGKVVYVHSQLCLHGRSKDNIQRARVMAHLEAAMLEAARR